MPDPSTNSWTDSATGAGPATTADDGVTASPNGDLRQRVASGVASAADTQKNRAADGLGSLADTAREASDELRAHNELLSSWAHAASDQLRHLGDRLRDRSAAELADDLSRFARERPAMFLGGAFLLGLGVARLLKSSPERAWSEGHRPPGPHAH